MKKLSFGVVVLAAMLVFAAPASADVVPPGPSCDCSTTSSSDGPLGAMVPIFVGLGLLVAVRRRG